MKKKRRMAPTFCYVELAGRVRSIPGTMLESFKSAGWRRVSKAEAESIDPQATLHRRHAQVRYG